MVVDGGVRPDQLGLRAGFDRFSHDGVCILVKRHYDVLVAQPGGDGKTSCLIGVDDAGDFDALQIYQVCLELLNLGGFNIRHDGRCGGG